MAAVYNFELNGVKLSIDGTHFIIRIDMVPSFLRDFNVYIFIPFIFYGVIFC
ncbi:UNVERIFIED_CONTAM: hypothetical protein FKN15_075854 [Acipenser sinensis]